MSPNKITIKLINKYLKHDSKFHYYSNPPIVSSMEYHSLLNIYLVRTINGTDIRNNTPKNPIKIVEPFYRSVWSNHLQFGSHYHNFFNITLPTI